MSDVLRCPQCRSVQVDAPDARGRRHCRACDARWSADEAGSRSAPDYVHALRRDRFDGQEPSSIWKK